MDGSTPDTLQSRLERLLRRPKNSPLWTDDTQTPELRYDKLDKSKWSFLELPWEIRNNVYESYYAAEVSIHLIYNNDSNQYRFPNLTCKRCAEMGNRSYCDNAPDECSNCSWDGQPCQRADKWVPNPHRFYRISTNLHKRLDRHMRIQDTFGLELLGLDAQENEAAGSSDESHRTNPRWSDISEGYCLDLLLACRTIYRETSTYPWELSTFNIVNSRIHTPNPKFGDYHCRLSFIHPLLFLNIRNLRLNGEIAWQMDPQQAVRGPVLARFPFLNDMMRVVLGHHWWVSLERISIRVPNPLNTNRLRRKVSRLLPMSNFFPDVPAFCADHDVFVNGLACRVVTWPSKIDNPVNRQAASDHLIGLVPEQVLYRHFESDEAAREHFAQPDDCVKMYRLARVPAGLLYTENSFEPEDTLENAWLLDDPSCPSVDVVEIRRPLSEQTRFLIEEYLLEPSVSVEIGGIGVDGFWIGVSEEYGL